MNEDTAPRRLTPSERAHELAMAIAARPPRVSVLDCELGQEARTKEWYVKSLSVPQNEGEDWLPWTTRAGEIAAALVASLPKSDDLTERLEATARAARSARDA